MADSDRDGLITLEEMAKCLEEPWVKAYFYALEMDPSEARSMFTIMDQNSDGQVDIEEFIDGCMKLKGNAKSIDMMSLMYDNSIFMQEFTSFSRIVTQQIEDLQEMMVQMSQVALKPPCNKETGV